MALAGGIYDFYYLPVQDKVRYDDVLSMRACLDYLGLDHDDDNEAKIYVDWVRINKMPSSEVEDLLTNGWTQVVTYPTFDTGMNGWQCGTIPPFTPPIYTRYPDGSKLKMQAQNNTNCYGSWTKNTGFHVTYDNIYVAEFTVRSDQTDKTRCPHLRLRMSFAGANGISGGAEIQSSNDDSSSCPDSVNGTRYHLAFFPPLEAEAEEIQLSFALLNFDSVNHAADGSLYLEQVTIYRRDLNTNPIIDKEVPTAPTLVSPGPSEQTWIYPTLTAGTVSDAGDPNSNQDVTYVFQLTDRDKGFSNYIYQQTGLWEHTCNPSINFTPSGYGNNVANVSWTVDLYKLLPQDDWTKYQEPLHWRVKAIDNAGNESAFSGPRTFWPFGEYESFKTGSFTYSALPLQNGADPARDGCFGFITPYDFPFGYWNFQYNPFDTSSNYSGYRSMFSHANPQAAYTGDVRSPAYIWTDYAKELKIDLVRPSGWQAAFYWVALQHAKPDGVVPYNLFDSVPYDGSHPVGSPGGTPVAILFDDVDWMNWGANRRHMGDYSFDDGTHAAFNTFGTFSHDSFYSYIKSVGGLDVIVDLHPAVTSNHLSSEFYEIQGKPLEVADPSQPNNPEATIEVKREHFLQGWYDFVYACVERYRGDIKLWEVGNQNNCFSLYPASPYSNLIDYPRAARNYAELVAVTCLAVKDADPNAKVGISVNGSGGHIPGVERIYAPQFSDKEGYFIKVNCEGSRFYEFMNNFLQTRVDLCDITLKRKEEPGEYPTPNGCPIYRYFDFVDMHAGCGMWLTESLNVLKKLLFMHNLLGKKSIVVTEAGDTTKYTADFDLLAGAGGSKITASKTVNEEGPSEDEQARCMIEGCVAGIRAGYEKFIWLRLIESLQLSFGTNWRWDPNQSKYFFSDYWGQDGVVDAPTNVYPNNCVVINLDGPLSDANLPIGQTVSRAELQQAFLKRMSIEPQALDLDANRAQLEWIQSLPQDVDTRYLDLKPLITDADKAELVSFWYPNSLRIFRVSKINPPTPPYNPDDYYVRDIPVVYDQENFKVGIPRDKIDDLLPDSGNYYWTFHLTAPGVSDYIDDYEGAKKKSFYAVKTLVGLLKGFEYLDSANQVSVTGGGYTWGGSALVDDPKCFAIDHDIGNQSARLDFLQRLSDFDTTLSDSDIKNSSDELPVYTTSADYYKYRFVTPDRVVAVCWFAPWAPSNLFGIDVTQEFPSASHLYMINVKGEYIGEAVNISGHWIVPIFSTDKDPVFVVNTLDGFPLLEENLPIRMSGAGITYPWDIEGILPGMTQPTFDADADYINRITAESQKGQGGFVHTAGASSATQGPILLTGDQSALYRMRVRLATQDRYQEWNPLATPTPPDRDEVPMVQVNLRAGTWSPTYGYQFQQGWFMTLDNKVGQSASALPGAEGYTYELYFRPQSTSLDPLFPEFLVKHENKSEYAPSSSMTLQSLVVEQIPYPDTAFYWQLADSFYFQYGNGSWYFDAVPGYEEPDNRNESSMLLLLDNPNKPNSFGYWVSGPQPLSKGWLYKFEFEVLRDNDYYDVNSPCGDWDQTPDLILKVAIDNGQTGDAEGAMESKVEVNARNQPYGGQPIDIVCYEGTPDPGTKFEVYFYPRQDALDPISNNMVIRFGLRGVPQTDGLYHALYLKSVIIRAAQVD